MDEIERNGKHYKVTKIVRGWFANHPAGGSGSLNDAIDDLESIKLNPDHEGEINSILLKYFDMKGYWEQKRRFGGAIADLIALNTSASPKSFIRKRAENRVNSVWQRPETNEVKIFGMGRIGDCKGPGPRG